MASIDELIALIAKDINKSNTSNTAIENSRAHAEELAELFRSMNVDGQATRTEQVQQSLAEALSQCTAVKAKLEEAKTRTEALKTPGAGDRTTVSAAPAATPLTAAPQAVREPVAKVGDPVKPVETLGVEPSESGQARRKRRRSAANLANEMTRKGEDAEDVLTKNTDVFDSMISVKLDGDDFFKPQGAVVASTAVPTHQEFRPAEQPKVGVGSALLATYVSTVVTIKASQWTHEKLDTIAKKWKQT